MKRYLLAIAISVFCLGKTQAQQHLIDSLTSLLQQPMADSDRAVSMMRLAIDYEVVDTAKAYNAYKEAIKFAVEKNLYFQLGRIYHNQAYLLSTAAQYAASMASVDTAIHYYQMVNSSKAKKWEANAYGDKAIYLRNQDELEQAIEYHLKSIAIFEQLDLATDLVVRYCNLATLFGDINEFTKQKEYAHKALASAKRSTSSLHFQMAYTIVALAHSTQDENELAKKYLDSANVTFHEYSNVDFMVTYYLVAAQVHKKLNQLDSAHYYFEQCLDVSKKYNFSFGKAESQIEMGAIAILEKKYGDAEKYLTAGVDEAKRMNSFNLLEGGYKYLSQIYALTGRYELAYETFQKFKEFSDTLVNLDSKKFITNLEKKYETEKKEKQILIQEAQLQKGKILNYVYLGSVVALIGISLVSYRGHKQNQRLQQQRISELEMEKQLTATEAVLKGEEQERSRLAKDLHDGLGGMLSGIKYSFNAMKGNLIMTPENHQAFERGMDMLDSSIKEMRRVAHNMMPETLVRFGLNAALQDYCSDINQSGALQVTYQSLGIENETFNPTTAITIYRIVQELVTNTMKHAAAKTAIVQLTKENAQLAITIEDDGKGFDTNILKQSKGIGWTNIQHRIDFLKGKLDINSQAGKGTSVHIEINL